MPLIAMRHIAMLPSLRRLRCLFDTIFFADAIATL